MADHMLLHVTSDLYQRGEVIEPGRWGRTVKSMWPHNVYMPRDTARQVLVETALETSRICLAPHAPSRLHCVYAWESLVDAETFRDRHRIDGLIYAVEPVRPDIAVHRGDLDFLWWRQIAGLPLEYISADSIRYWLDEPETMVEVLIGGPVRIADCLFDEGSVWASRICSHSG